MNTPGYLVVTVLVATALFFGIRWLVRVCSRYRGTKFVTCPETGRPAIVEVDALHASMTSTVGILESLYSFFDAEGCLLLMPASEKKKFISKGR